MPVFQYTALNNKGKNVKGSIDAESARVARQKLRSQALFPTVIEEAGIETAASSQDIKRYFRVNNVSTKELSVSTRQLATLVRAGLPLVSALHALSDQTDSLILQRIIIDVREDVEEGLSLAEALGKFPKSFPRLYVNLVAAGEASGTLDVVLENLADYLEGQVELRRKVNSALLYPVLMLIICTLVIVALFVFVIPKIIVIFEKQGVILPLPTRLMIFVSNSLVNYWYFIPILGFAAIFVFRWYYQQKAGRAKVDSILLKLPIFSSIYIKVITARVANTLGTLLHSGVGLLRGLDITRNIIGNVHITEALENAKEGVREGRSLANELGKSGYFPAMLSHMIAVGERSGALEKMLQNAGQSYEKEVNASLEGLTSLLEPLLMILVGIIVLVIVVSVLLPMADMINIVGG